MLVPKLCKQNLPLFPKSMISFLNEGAQRNCWKTFFSILSDCFAMKVAFGAALLKIKWDYFPLIEYNILRCKKALTGKAYKYQVVLPCKIDNNKYWACHHDSWPFLMR